MSAPTLWRFPAAETEDYPKLWVDDARVSGSITIGQSRLPLWAIIGYVCRGGWPEVLKGWDYIEDRYAFTGDDLAEFLRCLLELRGEFGRLLCVLADVERHEFEREARNVNARPWWQRRQDRRRVADALRRCLVALGEDEPEGAAA